MADEYTRKIAAVSMQGAVSPEPIDVDTEYDDVKKDLQTRFELLPEDIKQAIVADKYQENLFSIAREQKLTYEELGTLETETSMVLLGMTKPADYRDELQSELRKNDTEINALVAVINERIFAPIRNSIEKLYEAKKEPGDYIKKESAEELKQNSTQATPIVTPNAIHYPSSASVLSNADASVLASTGVVITPTPVAPIAPTSEIADRANLLASIENPSKIAPNIVAAKLNVAGAVMTPTKATDYTVPKAQAPAAGTPQGYIKNDPYREPLD